MTVKRRRWNVNGAVARYRDKRKIARLLASEKGEEIKARVNAGARWLASQDPDWAVKIDRASRSVLLGFDLTNCRRCAVGTVLGDWSIFRYNKIPGPGYGNARKGTKDSGGAHLGFCLTDDDHNVAFDDYDSESDLLWAAVEQAWVDRVREELEK